MAVFNGDSANNNLTGSESDDQMSGLAGNDTLAGLGGADSLDGGQGNDSLLGNDGADTLRGAEGADTLNGGAGNDVLDGGIITDTVNYTDGNWVRFDGATTGVVVNLGTGTAQDGQGGTDALSNLGFVIGTQHDDQITGSATTFFEQFEGGLGNDTIDGGAINAGNNFAANRVSYVNSATAVTVNLATGVATGQGTDSLVNISQVRGSAQADTLIGSDTTAYLEVFEGRGGNDTINGGGGADQYRADGATGSVTVDLMTGTAFDGQGGTDTLSNIEQARGFNFNDMLIGDNNANVLQGMGGDDHLEGNGGNDNLQGGAGDDYIVGGGGNDTIDGGQGLDIAVYDFQDAATAITFVATGAGGTQLDLLGGTDTLIGIEEMDIYGGTAADTITGDAMRQIIFGNSGNDTLAGGGGNDSFVYFAGIANGIDRITDFTRDADDLSFEEMELSTMVLSGDNASGLMAGQVMVGNVQGGVTRIYVGTDDVAGADIMIDMVGTFRHYGFDVVVEDWGTYMAYYGPTEGDDELISEDTNDSFEGLGGNDYMDGAGGNDSLDGGAGNDTILGGTGADTLIGGAGNDSLDGGTVTDIFNLTDLNVVRFDGATTGVTVNFATGVAQDGQGGTDSLANINFVVGTAFNDSLTGTSGGLFEQFEGGEGNDTIDGGAITISPTNNSHNRVVYANATQAVQVDLAAGTATGQGNDVLANISFVRGSNFGDTLLGSNTTAYTEIFDGRGGNDTVNGLGGVDQYRTESATTGALIDLMAGTAQDGQGGTDTLIGIEYARGGNFNDTLIGSNDANSLQGMNGNDSLVGNDGNDTVAGGEGQDTLWGGAGDDLIDGGNNVQGDFDWAIFANATAALNINLATGTATGEGNDTLAGIEAVVAGSGNDSIVGTAGENFLRGNGGDDTLDGAGGLDWADYRGQVGAITVNLTAGTASGAAGNDLLLNMEAIRAGDGNDNLTGDGNNNWIRGQLGDDTIDGAGGFDMADYREAATAVNVSLVTNTSSGGNGNDVLSNIEGVRGGAGNDTLTGNAQNNRLDGFQGNDTLLGGGGADTLQGADGDDLVDGGDGDDNDLRGGLGNDTILGGAGNDYIFAGAGEGGTDSIDGGEGYDVVNYSLQANGNSGAFFFSSGWGTGSRQQFDTSSNYDTLVNIEEVHVFGTQFDDNIYGDGGRNWIQGNGGNDFLQGSGGDDTFAFDVGMANGIDRINDFGMGDSLSFNQFNGPLFQINGIQFGDSAGGLMRGDVMVGTVQNGMTRVYVGTDGVAGADLFVDLQGGFNPGEFGFFNDSFGARLQYGMPKNLVGTDANDSLFGGELNDTLIGNGGDDSLGGNGGNDYIDGGAGRDNLFGNTGDDYIYAGDGDDYIGGGGEYDGGSDTIDGGAGYDSVAYNFQGAMAPVTFYATGASGMQGDPLGGMDTLFNIEQVDAYGSAGGDTFVGDSQRNYFAGNGGNDTLTGGTGGDMFAYDPTMAQGIDRITDFDGQDSLNFNNFTVGGTVLSGDDASGLAQGQLMVGSTQGGVTRVYLGTDGVAGADLMIDLVGSFEAANFQVYSDIWGSSLTYFEAAPGEGTPGNDNLVGTGGDDFLNGLGGNDTIDGGAGNDNLTGGPGNDSLLGGDGNDYISAGGDFDGGSDTIDGGAGNDVASYSFFNSAVPVWFTSTGASGIQADPFGGTDTLLNVEEVHIFGSSHGDTLAGDSQRNYIMGNAGDDTLTGGGNDDNFAYDVTQASGTDRITDLSAGDNLSFQSFTLSTTVLSGDDASGLASGQVMVGTTMGGVTRVFVGTDGNAGADLAIDLQGSFAAADFSVFNDFWGAGLHYSGPSIPSGVPSEGNDSLAGTGGNDFIDALDGNDTVDGFGGRDTLIGGAGDDLLFGSADDDRLIGGLGNDTLDGGSGMDIAEYNFNSVTPVTFISTVDTGGGSSTQADGLGGTDTLVGIDELHVFGGSAGDTFVGAGERDFLEGRGGNDTLTGGAGNDTFAFHVDGNDLGIDRVTDLQAGENLHFRMLAVETNVQSGNGTGLLQGQVAIGAYDSGSNTTKVFVGTNGTAGADLVIDLAGNYSASDFRVSNFDGHGNLDYVPGLNLTGTGANDTLNGSDSSDTLSGLGGDDNLWGAGGNDTLLGGDGNDFLQGGAGNDSIDGGAGFGDMAGYFDSQSAVTVNLATGAVGGAAAGDVLVNIENLGGSGFADSLTGDAQGNYIDGGDGNDAISGLAGNDNLVGGLGNDTIDGGSENDFLEGQAGNDVLSGGAGQDSFAFQAGAGDLGVDRVTDLQAGENLHFRNLPITSVAAGNGSGLAQGQVAIGAYDAGTNTTRVYVGTDAAAGADLMVDLTGNYGAADWRVFNDAHGNLTWQPGMNLTGTEGPDNLMGGQGHDTITGLGGNDTLNGNDGNDVLNGGAGTDILSGGLGDDTLDGGVGQFDFAGYGDALSAVTVNLATGTATGGAGNDTLLNIDNVGGSSFNDVLTGNAGDNNLSGEGGNDTLVGGDGSDFLNGGYGNDSMDGGAGNDYADYGWPQDAGGVTVNLTTGTASGAFGSDTLAGIENILGSAGGDQLTGDGGNNYFDGRDGNDSINGMAGDDNLYGGLGNDTLDGGAGAGDNATFFNAANGVTVNLAAGTATGEGSDTLLNIENIEGSNFADSLTGNAGNNYIFGGNGDDALFGLDGNDFLQGGLGNDTLDGGSGVGDFATYFNAAAGVTVSLVTNTATGGAGNDTLLNIEDLEGSAFGDSLAGNDGANELRGYDGNDTLAGNGGNDFLHGGNGNDSMLGGAGRDTLVGAAGNDTMDGGAILDRANYTDFNLVSYAGVGAINLNLATGIVQDGQGGTDTLSNINFVVGSSFNDVLVGSSTSNLFERFEGGAGDDFIDGGAADLVTQSNTNRVVYGTATGAVTVNLAAGTATGAAGNDTLVNIQQVAGSNFGDTLTGSDSAFTEDFDGSGGNDTINGAGGLDAVRYDSGTVGINANLATGTSTDGLGGTDTLLNIEGVRGTNFNDTLTGGNAANDALEFFTGNGGNDTIDGGSGFDRVQYSSSTTGVTVTLGGAGAGTASDGLGGTDTLLNIEGVRGSAFNDTLTGSDVATLEVFDGRQGDDVIDGRGGIDRVDYSGDLTGVNVNLATGVALDGFGNTDTLSNIEDVRGSGYNDTILGNAGANRIEGGGGNDTIDGGAGLDTAVFAGNRADYTIIRNGSTYTVSGANGIDVLARVERVSFADGTLSLAKAAADFNGDGKSDLLWHDAADGDNALWSAADSGQALPAGTMGDPRWEVAGIGDFDGNGQADVLWRHATTGDNVAWRGGNSAAVVAVAAVAGTSWKVAGVGDFNGDGASDILWRNATSGQNVVWRNGDSSQGQVLESIADRNWRVAGVGDFNGDGASDILWRNSATGDNLVWRYGDNTQGQAVASVAESDAKLAGIGDFDGDGTSDLLWRDAASGENTIWSFDATGSQRQIQAMDGQWKVGAVGDYDGDGTADIVWRNAGTGENVLWSGGDSGQAVALDSLAGDQWQLPRQAGTTPRSPAVHDLDGDGASDLLWRNGGTGANVAWGEADADAAHDITAMSAPAWKVVALADFDTDGKADIFWRNAATGENVIWSAGNPDATLPVATLADAAWKVAGVGDFSGDRAADILWRNDYTGQNVVWRNGDSSQGQILESVADQNWRVAGIGDFNGDGSSDILWRNAASGDNVVWRGGDNTQGQAVASIAESDAKLAGIGDFNGDGTSDLLWRNGVTGANVIWSSGDAASQQQVQALNGQWKVGAVGDYDGDGKADIVWRNAGTGQNVLWSGGDGAHTVALDGLAGDQWQLPGQAGTTPRAPADFDLDGDGTSDLVWRHAGNGYNAAWGGATESDWREIAATPDLSWKIAAVADFDADGRSDIFWRNGSTGENVIWSAGNVNVTQHVDNVPTAEWKVAGVGDFNGDRGADILWRNESTGQNVVWRGGDSAQSQAVDTVWDQSWKVAGIGDFNRDGADDILWRNAVTGDNVVWRSGESGQGQFVSSVGDMTWKVAGIGDFNGDGVDDMLWRNDASGDNVIWRGADSSQGQGLASQDVSWKVAGTGDYNGDGTSDILWRNATTGEDSVWLGGDSAKVQAVEEVSDTAWEIPAQDHTWLQADGTYGV